MKEYCDKRYEGLYEKEYEAMEMSEKMEGILHVLEGISDVLTKLLTVIEEGAAKEKKNVVKPGFKIGADGGLEGFGLEGKVDAIARGFGNA